MLELCNLFFCVVLVCFCFFFFFFQAEDGIRDLTVTGVQTCALPICFRVFRSRSWTPRTRRGSYLMARQERYYRRGRICFPATGMSVLTPRRSRSEERRVGKEWRSRWSPEH